jgi:hypothetical protein
MKGVERVKSRAVWGVCRRAYSKCPKFCPNCFCGGTGILPVNRSEFLAITITLRYFIAGKAGPGFRGRPAGQPVNIIGKDYTSY